MTKEQQDKLNKVIDEFAADPDIKALVEEIEKRPATTQHHYGDYGAALSQLSKGSKTMAYVLAQAMKQCGGHPVGIGNAFKLFV